MAHRTCARGGRCLLVVPDRGRWRLRRAGGGGDLDFALAGGVDIGLDPVDLVGLARAGALATQEMRIYDATPTGFLLGEGCGIVALIRAEDAHATAVPVYADITGWGISSAGNGRAISGPDGLLLALRRAYKRAEADPAHVQLFEGHAAGIAASDLAELTALTSLRADAPPRAAQPAALGSIKANIGHTRAAAGVAGLLKAVLAMSAGTLPRRRAASSRIRCFAARRRCVCSPRRSRGRTGSGRLAARARRRARRRLVLASRRGRRASQYGRGGQRCDQPGSCGDHDGARFGPGWSRVRARLESVPVTAVSPTPRGPSPRRAARRAAAAGPGVPRPASR